MNTENQFDNDTTAEVRDDKDPAHADAATATAGSLADYAYDRTIRSVRVDTVLIGKGRRPCNPEQARMIADSMAQVGLINPITVTTAQQIDVGASEIGATLNLVAGLHRLEAAKLLGWTHIDAIVVAADRIDDRLREIAENLCRGELTVLEQAEFVDEWASLIREKVGQVARPGGLQPNDQGISRAANVLGLTRERVRRSKVIAGISPEAKAAAKAAYLSDNQKAKLQNSPRPRRRSRRCVRRRHVSRPVMGGVPRRRPSRLPRSLKTCAQIAQNERRQRPPKLICSFGSPLTGLIPRQHRPNSSGPSQTSRLSGKTP